ncbi:MAG: hypothetical protein HYU87_09105 [Chloroflexi bacterium]|nr:hypothetical protein [Chloroflexota bacterium]
MHRRRSLAVALAALALVVGACGQGGASIATGERTYYLTGLEYKGSTVTKDLAAPDVDPAKLSDGYRYKKPGDADKSDATKWEVSTYRWEPGLLVGRVGDKLTLVTFIVNGDKHNTWVEGPDGKEVVAKVLMNRGREYKTTVTLDKPGIYRFVCEEHDPTMTTYIWALPVQ